MDRLKKTKPARDNGHADRGIGYRRPPERTRYKPGQSGNPRGRPKGMRNFKTDLKATLRMPVNVTRRGKSQKVSTQQAMLMRLREKALSGAPRELVQLILLAQSYNNDEVIDTRSLSASDETILQIFRGRVLSGAAATYEPAEDRRQSIRNRRSDQSSTLRKSTARTTKRKRVRFKKRVRSTNKHNAPDKQMTNENKD